MKYYINIGSNLGNRLMNLSKAVAAIEKEFGWFELSHHIESEAWGYDSANKFLNIGMLFISDREPLDVLHTLQDIEKSLASDIAGKLKLPSSHTNPNNGKHSIPDNEARSIPGDTGRTIPGGEDIFIPGLCHRNPDGSYADRILDIDIMAVDDIRMETPELTLPHPHLSDRPFFLDAYRELLESPH